MLGGLYLRFTAIVFTPKWLKSDVLLVTTVNLLIKAVAAMMASGVLVLNCCLSWMACSAIASFRSNTVAWLMNSLHGQSPGSRQ